MKNYSTFYPKNWHKALRNMGWWFGKNLSRIPGSKKHRDHGSGSATLSTAFQFRHIFLKSLPNFNRRQANNDIGTWSKWRDSFEAGISCRKSRSSLLEIITSCHRAVWSVLPSGNLRQIWVQRSPGSLPYECSYYGINRSEPWVLWPENHLLKQTVPRGCQICILFIHRIRRERRCFLL